MFVLYTNEIISNRHALRGDDAEEILDSATLLYVGHGTPVAHSTSVLRTQKAYLLMLREVVQRLTGGEGSISDEAKQELIATMTAFTGGARMSYLLEWGSDALAQELAETPLK